MAQDVPAVAQLFGVEETTLARLRETLSTYDQQAMDALLEFIEHYRLVEARADRALPGELLLLFILIEQQRMLQFLFDRLDYYDQKLYAYKTGRIQAAGPILPSQSTGR